MEGPDLTGEQSHPAPFLDPAVSCLPHHSRRSSSRLDEQPQGFTISPTTRKRKAAEATISSGSLPKRFASAGPEAAPPTPLTSASNTMDSDDDFNSAASSKDDGLQDYSDNDDMSGIEGSLLLPPHSSRDGPPRKLLGARLTQPTPRL